MHSPIGMMTAGMPFNSHELDTLEWCNDPDPTSEHAPPIDHLDQLESRGLVDVAGASDGFGHTAKLVIVITARGRYQLEYLRAQRKRHEAQAAAKPIADNADGSCGACGALPAQEHAPQCANRLYLERQGH